MNIRHLTLGFIFGVVAMVVIGASLSPSNLNPNQFTNSGPANGQPFISIKDGAAGTNLTIENITIDNSLTVNSNVTFNITNSVFNVSNVTFHGKVTFQTTEITNAFITNAFITYLTNITAYVTNLYAVTEYVTNLNVTYLTNQTFYTTNITAITVNASTNFVTENFSTNLFATNIITTNLFATFITNNTFFTTNVNTTQLTVNSNLFVTTNTFVTDITTNIFVTFSTNIFLTDNFVSNYFTTNVFNDTFMSNYFNTNLYLYVTNVAVTNLYVTNIVNNNSYVSNFFQTNIFQNTYNSNFFSTNLFSTVQFITTNFFLFPGTNFPGLYGQALITDGLSNDFWAFVFHSANLSNEGPLTVLGNGTAAGSATVFDADGTTGLGGFATNAGKKGFWTASPYGFTDGSGPGDNSIAISGAGGRIKYTNSISGLAGQVWTNDSGTIRPTTTDGVLIGDVSSLPLDPTKQMFQVQQTNVPPDVGAEFGSSIFTFDGGNGASAVVSRNLGASTGHRYGGIGAITGGGSLNSGLIGTAISGNDNQTNIGVSGVSVSFSAIETNIGLFGAIMTNDNVLPKFTKPAALHLATMGYPNGKAWTASTNANGSVIGSQLDENLVLTANGFTDNSGTAGQLVAYQGGNRLGATNGVTGFLPSDIAYTDKNNAFTTASSNYFAKAWAFSTNQNQITLDMSLPEQLISTNASFTLIGPVGVDTTKTTAQWHLCNVTNSSGSLINITAPANCHPVGTANCTNWTGVWVQVYAQKVTNVFFLPVF